MIHSRPANSNHTSIKHRLVVMGSTGSIGVNTLNVVAHLNTTGACIEIVGLAAGRNTKLLIDQAKQFQVPAVAISDKNAARVLEASLPGVTIYCGPNAALQLIEASDATDVSAAIVGSAGLPATLAAIRKGLRIGLANKETLVAAGALVSPLVKRCGTRLIPVDSEHSAIFQCLDGQPTRTIKRIVLTASGGPFRTMDKAEMDHATVEEALCHPTWNMGPKITVDSATMMNKALEIIEAHWLFELPGEKIEVIIHPQSTVHSFVEFADNSILAQMGPPDMRTPIQYALMYPNCPVGCSQALDWQTLTHLTFEQPDHDKFGALNLAYDVIDAGGTAGAIFNAANETAVEAFLARKIRFGRIVELVGEALDQIESREADSLDTILAADREAREWVASNIGVKARPTADIFGRKRQKK